MNRNHKNRGGRQGQQPMRHTRNNPVYDDLFASSRAPSETSSDSLPAIATLGRGEHIDAPLPAEIVRRHPSDYARPVVQRQTTRVNAPLQRGANFKIDSHILGLLPTFHGTTIKVSVSTCGRVHPGVRIQRIPQCLLGDGQDALLPFHA